MTKFLKKLWHCMVNSNKNNTYKPYYRVLELIQDEDNNYTAQIQVINKSLTFYSKPEEILVDDKLVNMFSPIDVRTLTYLGYLGINSPKYKILAQRLLNNQRTVFIIKKSGKKNIIVKTAAELLQEQDMITSMSPDDAKTIGYTVAIENTINEQDIKHNLSKQL